MKKVEWKWRGLAGHLCVANDCRFHLCTDIGGYKISTVGAYYPKDAKAMETIGYHRHYETYVFKIDSEGEILDNSEIEGDGLEFKPGMSPYALDKQAEEMHMRMCNKYDAIAKKKGVTA